MAKEIFYLGVSDCEMAQDVISKDPDMYIERYEFVGKGVYANATSGTSTLTPATSPAWVADDYISTLSNNLIVVDDNLAVAEGKITDNDATSVTFDETALTLASDDSTAPTFTASATYCFYVLTAAPRVAQGSFWGQIRNSELNITSEYKKLISRDPGELISKNLQSRMFELTIPYVEKAQEDFYDLLALEQIGSQTSQAKYGMGASERSNPFFRLTALNTDNEGRTITLVMRKVQFDLSGNWWNKGDSGNFEQPLHADLLADQFYPKNARYAVITRTDT